MRLRSVGRSPDLATRLAIAQALITRATSCALDVALVLADREVGVLYGVSLSSSCAWRNRSEIFSGSRARLNLVPIVRQAFGARRRSPCTELVGVGKQVALAGVAGDAVAAEKSRPRASASRPAQVPGP